MKIKKIKQNTRDFNVKDPIFEGGTDLNETVFNQLQTNIEDVTQRDITTDGEPVKCGYKVDGKDVYVKRVNYGTMPNATSKEVSHGLDITKITVLKVEGIARANNIYLNLPHATTDKDTDIMFINWNNVYIRSGIDRSEFTAYIYIYFTYND